MTDSLESLIDAEDAAHTAVIDALAAQQRIVTPQSKASMGSDVPLKAVGLRMSMWVTKDGITGIVTGCSLDGIAEITMTKPDGTTRMVLDENDKAVPMTYAARVEDLRQATHDELPESRRPTEDMSVMLGYTKAAPVQVAAVDVGGAP